MPDKNREHVERYARALVALGEAVGDLSVMERDGAALLDLIEGSEPLRRFLGDSLMKEEGKAQALRELLAAKVCPALMHFLLILTEERRIHLLRAILNAFFNQIATLRRQETAVVVTAAPLSPERIAAIEEQVSLVLGKDVHLRVQVEPSLLGGVKLRVGDLILDGTVDAQLDKMRDELLA